MSTTREWQLRTRERFVLCVDTVTVLMLRGKNFGEHAGS